MIYLYPANKMENLLVLLDKIQQVSPLPIFSKDVVIVQNAGMQHWLNMSLAKQRGISMNIDYALPSQFLWKLVRTIASDEDVPDQSPFSREVLAWRIFSLLAQKDVIDDEDFTTATRYWSANHNESSPAEQSIKVDQKFIDNNNHEFASDEELKRYQLACQMADLFEQYLIFRPTWINEWENGNFTAGIAQEEATNIAKWQGKLWYLLTREQSYNPILLIEQAISQLKVGLFDEQHLKDNLPKRISFFGINIMAPMWLSFVNELIEYVDVHFFHLNPCYSYWGDVITEKKAIRSIQKWVDGFDDITSSVGNPLLANLGQQGREFMALLHGYSTINIDAFEDIHESDISTPDHHNQVNDSTELNTPNNVSVLQQVQHDILTLSDARSEPCYKTDNSIVITSCHSALREVQGLHDWLLHQFNDNQELTPKDVLVMCPQVEEYAPYINAVFARGWQEFDDKVPPLPCSIADRVSKDSEPVVAAFADLLTLPDSRFQVSQLLSFLRIPAMQSKFDLSIEDIDKFSVWLDHASVHWGIDQTHKQQTLKSASVSNSFTWQQGLSRLLRGFAYGDQEIIYDNQLILPSIEGNDGELLGKLMLILEQLQLFSINLAKQRTAEQWKTFLTTLINELFDVSDDDGFIIVEQAIESLIEYCSHAKYESNIDLLIVRDFLNQHFSEPDPGRQFIVGQVTFCSMLPMRSIPFKVIAILGLNDGLFPRQRQPLSFDLMSVTPAMLGDRSRRGDDRYLFLEAIISARQSLYLSYQGKNIKNNAPKQASLVLKELMEYLELGYGWSLLDEGSSEEHDVNSNEETDEAIKDPNNNKPLAGKLRHLPMQPFSDKNYRGSLKSFDNHWLNINLLGANEANVRENPTIKPLSQPLSELLDQEPDGSYSLNLDLSKLISFLQHPSRYFAQSQLNLDLNIQSLELSDVEPFEFDRLQSYLLREQLIKSYLPNSDNSLTIENIEHQVEQTLKSAALSGKFPEGITRDITFENWKQDSEQFSSIIQEHSAIIQSNDNHTISFTMQSNALVGGQLNEKSAPVNIKVKLSTSLPISGNKLVFYRSSSPKFKDFITLYLHQCFLILSQNQQCELDEYSLNDKAHKELNVALNKVNASHGFYFDTKSQKVTQFKYGEVVDAKSQLTKFIDCFIKGSHQPLLVNGEIAEKAFSAKVFEQEQFERYWDDPNSMMSLGHDPYIHYFWPYCPNIDEVRQALEELYLDMFNAREQIK